MARTHLDDTLEYKASVREAIVAWAPDEETVKFDDGTEADGIDEHVLDLTSCYLWWNGYKDDNDLYADTPGTDNTAHFVYDVLKWTEENT